MNCHLAHLASIGILVLVLLERAECSDNHCDASGDNPEKCKPTVRNHLLNTIRTLWQDELKEEVKGLIASKDTEIAQLNVSHNLLCNFLHGN